MALEHDVVSGLLTQVKPVLPLVCRPCRSAHGDVRVAFIATRPPNGYEWWVRQHVLLLTPRGTLIEGYESQTLGLSVSSMERWDRFPLELVVAGLKDVLSRAVITDGELRERRERFEDKLRRILVILDED